MIGLSLSLTRAGVAMGAPSDPLVIQTVSGQFITAEEGDNIVIEEAPDA